MGVQMSWSVHSFWRKNALICTQLSLFVIFQRVRIPLKSLASILVADRILNVMVVFLTRDTRIAFIGTFPSSSPVKYVTFTYVNPLRPSDAIWQHTAVSILAQVVTYCLTEPSHCPNQCWLAVRDVHQPEGSFAWKVQTIYLWYEFEHY